MAKKLRFVNALVCDFVTEGARNKHVLVGVYSADIVVGSLPALLSLALYMELDTSRMQGIVKLGWDVLVDDKVVAHIAGQLDCGNASRIASIGTQAVRVPVSQEGVFRVVAKAEGYEPKEVIRKRLLFAGVSGLTPTSAPS